MSLVDSYCFAKLWISNAMLCAMPNHPGSYKARGTNTSPKGLAPEETPKAPDGLLVFPHKPGTTDWWFVCARARACSRSVYIIFNLSVRSARAVVHVRLPSIVAVRRNQHGARQFCQTFVRWLLCAIAWRVTVWPRRLSRGCCAQSSLLTTLVDGREQCFRLVFPMGVARGRSAQCGLARPVPAEGQK